MKYILRLCRGITEDMIRFQKNVLTLKAKGGNGFKVNRIRKYQLYHLRQVGRRTESQTNFLRIITKPVCQILLQRFSSRLG